jgi:hypothetical protein
LGESVTVKTGSIRGVGRIYGYPATNIGNGNYALDSMSVKFATSYDGALESQTVVPGLTTPDGANATIFDFMDSRFWIEKLRFNLVDGGRPANPTVWNFSRVANEGFPRLEWE